MGVVSPRELLLEYLYDVGRVEAHKLMTDLSKICWIFGEKGIHAPIDFSSFGKYPESGVLEEALWGLQTGGAIEEHKGSVTYSLTERGKKLTEKYRERRTEDEIRTWEVVNASMKNVLGH